MALNHYLTEIIPALALGFFLSGLIHEFVPQEWVKRKLGKVDVKSIFYATLTGTLLPICCWGALPVAVSFYRKGSRLGPVLAFLVATPATSISALIVTYQLLGLKVAVFIFFAVIFMGLSIGIMGNKIPFIKPCPTNRMDSGSPIDDKSEDRCSIKDAGLNKVPNLLSLASPIEHPDSSLPSVDLPESVPLVRQGLILSRSTRRKRIDTNKANRI